MPSYRSNQAISSNGDYDVDNIIDGVVYQITTWFPSGVTGSVALKEQAPDGSFQAVEDNGTDVVFTATGKRGVLFSTASKTMRFTVSDLTGGNCFISIKPATRP